MVAKNFLELKELTVLNNLVSAYFDLTEINAMEEKPMKMTDYIQELDNILKPTGREILDNSGKISHQKTKEKVTTKFSGGVSRPLEHFVRCFFYFASMLSSIS